MGILPLFRNFRCRLRCKIQCMKEFLELEIDQRFANNLPADHLVHPGSRQVHEACYSYVNPRVPSQPKLVRLSSTFLKELKLNVSNHVEFTQVMSGAIPFRTAQAYAMCYGGHQFGHWAGQLGDGRAINIAELNINDENYKFQLKGAGATPYSRGSDGLAVLRSSIREYLCSEAMHHLGVPTTRALSLVTTGDLVARDMLYNGNVREEIGAIVCRVSPSFVRFGSFEIFASRQDHDTMKKLLDHVITEHYPELGTPSKETYLQFFEEVVKRTRAMIVHWQRVGFVHGVMNTDNMSILGLTIDYGPYGWLENYDPAWTPNTTDAQHRRYRFGNQPKVALWNLAQLANALFPLIDNAPALEAILDNFSSEYQVEYLDMMRRKLGLNEKRAEDNALVDELVELLEISSVDMTIFFRSLSGFEAASSFIDVIQNASYLDEEEFKKYSDSWISWLESYDARLKIEYSLLQDRRDRMNRTNPKYVLRNYMAQLTIDAAENGDYSVIDELYQLLEHPYNEQPEMEKWFAKRPDWALNKVGCSMLSCSS